MGEELRAGPRGRVVGAREGARATASLAVADALEGVHSPCDVLQRLPVREARERRVHGVHVQECVLHQHEREDDKSEREAREPPIEEDEERPVRGQHQHLQRRRGHGAGARHDEKPVYEVDHDHIYRDNQPAVAVCAPEHHPVGGRGRPRLVVRLHEVHDDRVDDEDGDVEQPEGERDCHAAPLRARKPLRELDAETTEESQVGLFVSVPSGLAGGCNLERGLELGLAGGEVDVDVCAHVHKPRGRHASKRGIVRDER